MNPIREFFAEVPKSTSGSPQWVGIVDIKSELGGGGLLASVSLPGTDLGAIWYRKRSKEAFSSIWSRYLVEFGQIFMLRFKKNKVI